MTMRKVVRNTQVGRCRLSRLAAVFALTVTTGSLLGPAAQAQDLNEIYKQFEQHRQAGRYAEAERLGQQAIGVCEARYGRNRIDCAWTLNNLAIVYHSQGKYAEAEGLYRRALAIQEKALGAGHPDVARPSTTWPTCITPRASTRRRRGCIGARWRSGRRRSAPATLTWPDPQQPGQRV